MISIRTLSGSILTALIVFGCSTSTTPAATCIADSTVDCSSSGTTGYSCPSGVAPDSSAGACGAPLTDANGNDDYCCGVTTGNSCTADSAVDCTASGTTGYSCNTGDVPPTSAGTCSDVTPTANGDTYCCGTTTTGPTCSPDSTVAGCTGSSSGFSCTGTDRPDDTASLICSEGVAGSGDTLYCCSDLTTPSTCMPDDTVTGCAGNSYGFSCTGSDAPDMTDTSIICSDGIATGSDTIYCCVDNTDASCAEDDTLNCTTPGSFGFSCTSSAAPTDPTLTCSAGTPDTDGTSTDFCCTN